MPDGGLPNGVGEGADALDAAGDFIARVQPFRRVKAHAHAGGRAHGDDRAGEQGHAAAELGDDIRDVKDHPVRGAVLPQLAVDAGGNMQGRWKDDLVSGDDARAYGGKAVQTFAKVPLFVGGLQDTG